MDAVVSVAAGLVNTLTPGCAHGREYEPPTDDRLVQAVNAVLSAGRRTRALSWEEAAGLIVVASELRAVFAAADEGAVDEAAGLVNVMLERTGARPVLERHDDEPWHLHFHSAGRSAADGWAASCATGLAVVLGSELYDRLGVCTAPRCDRVFVDTSRNGTRRYCSTSCQNRVKTAAFRARAS